LQYVNYPSQHYAHPLQYQSQIIAAQQAQEQLVQIQQLSNLHAQRAQQIQDHNAQHVQPQVPKPLVAHPQPQAHSAQPQPQFMHSVPPSPQQQSQKPLDLSPQIFQFVGVKEEEDPAKSKPLTEKQKSRRRYEFTSYKSSQMVV